VREKGVFIVVTTNCIVLAITKQLQLWCSHKVFIKATEALWCVMHLWWLYSAQQPSGRLFTIACSGPLTTSMVTSVCKCMVTDNVATTTHQVQPHEETNDSLLHGRAGRDTHALHELDKFLPQPGVAVQHAVHMAAVEKLSSMSL
jgi:hypothetical protein